MAVAGALVIAQVPVVVPAQEIGALVVALVQVTGALEAAPVQVTGAVEAPVAAPAQAAGVAAVKTLASSTKRLPLSKT